MATPKTKKPKKTFHCLLVKKGKQFIKIDISHTPYICKVTRDLFESKGYTCRYFMHQAVNYPLNNLLRKVEQAKKNSYEHMKIGS